MSRPNVRHRQVDHTKPFLIVREYTDLLKDDVEQTTIESLRDTLVTKALEKTKKTDITIPQAKTAKGEKKEANGKAQQSVKEEKKPTPNGVKPESKAKVIITSKKPDFIEKGHYIRFKNPRDLNPEFVTDYEIDQADIDFLNSLHEEHNKEIFSFDDFEKLINLWEKDTGKGEIIPLERADYLSNREAAFPQDKHEYLERVYRYWKEKRDKFKRSLIRDFWKTPSTDDPNPNVVFRPHEKKRPRRPRKPDPESREKILKLKSDFEKMRDILLKVKQREQQKKDLIQLDMIAFDQQIGEKVDSSYTNPRWTSLKKKLQASMVTHQPSKINEKHRTEIKPPVSVVPDYDPKVYTKVGFDFAAACCNFVGKLEKEGMDVLSGTIPEFKQKLPPQVELVKHNSEAILAQGRIVDPVPKTTVTHPQNTTMPTQGDPLQMKRVMQPTHRLPEKNKEEVVKKEPKKVRPFQLRGRIGRGGRVFIDRFLVKNEFDPYAAFGAEEKMDTADDEKPTNQMNVNEGAPAYDQYLKMQYGDIYDMTDSDEDINEVGRQLRRQIGSGFRNFTRQKRSTSTPILEASPARQQKDKFLDGFPPSDWNHR